MKRIKLWHCLFLLLYGIMMASCTKNDNSTIVLIGTEYYMGNYNGTKYYIDDIISLIPDSLQAKFMAEFGAIPEGPVPPRLDFDPQDSTLKIASYVMDPKQRLGSSIAETDWPLQTIEPNVYLRFSNQHNGIAKMDLNESTETMTDTVFVQGNGKDFVVYFIEDKAYEMGVSNTTYHVKIRRGVLMKGQVASNGLKDFRYATIIMDTEDDSHGFIGQYPNGSYFIYKDGNGIAERFDW